MIGCLLVAFALCNAQPQGYYVQPSYPQQQMVYAQQPPPAYYVPAPVYAYAPPVAVVPVIRFGGWGGGHRGRW